VELAGLDLWVFLGDGGEALVPVGHGDGDAVRLGGGATSRRLRVMARSKA
jgi:hypothetical protein